MEPNEIRAGLILLGVSQTSIARDLKITRGTVASVVGLHRKSKRIQKAIAKILKKPFEKVWGDAA